MLYHVPRFQKIHRSSITQRDGNVTLEFTSNWVTGNFVARLKDGDLIILPAVIVREANRGTREPGPPIRIRMRIHNWRKSYGIEGKSSK